ncbi:MAG: putative F420-dependent oxidoreductase [Hyphomicrobiaceae bacterium]|jgi:probable F420-dependent oxidoreductase
MTVGVGIGLAECPFSDGAGFWRWVDMCEAGGVDSIWQTDRLISPMPMLECMSVMAALAGRTKRMRFGMNVVSMAMRDPVLCAKQCATIDFLSEGRVLPAFGIGSPLGPEWDAMDLSTKTRGRVTDEALDVIAKLWTEDHVDFEGRHFTLRDATISPKPVQRELPMWIGGGSKAAIARTARVGTGWIGGPETPAETAPIVAGIRAAVKDAGRSIDDDHYGSSFPFYFGRMSDDVMKDPIATYAKRSKANPADYFGVGDADAIVERIAEYVEAGVSKFIVRPVAVDEAFVLEQTQRLIDEVLPKVEARFN